uniref:Putative glycosyltransferase n=1 Tax=viral metagenome TaxID=1070528 RepID=A0A6M3M7I5_9ZZZZ
MIKISLLHPSFGRPKKAFEAYQEWKALAENRKEIEYLIGLDDTDPTTEEYRSIFSSRGEKFENEVFLIGSSRTIIQAVNQLAALSSICSELLVFVADDISPCPQWDIALLNVIKDKDKSQPMYIYVTDHMMPYGTWGNNMIINRVFYNKFGYFLYPEYDGVCCDNDLYEVAKRLDAIIQVPEIVFEHKHYIRGMATMDSTYLRHNNNEGRARNGKIYASRVARNFDL